MYNYIEEMRSGIKDYLRQNYENHKDEKGKYVFKKSELDRLRDEVFISDTVTWNASGSYVFNSYKAEENLCHNLNLLLDSCHEFGFDVGEAIEKDAEHCDVLIRCYLVDSVLFDVIEIQ